MTLLSYREAARIARRSATALHKAVKSGMLKRIDRDGESGFDINDVRQWSNQRWTAEEIGVATETFHAFWTSTAVGISALFGMARDKREKFEILTEGIFNFVEVMLRNEENRYCFSEGVMFSRDNYLENAIEICGFEYKDDLVNDLETRYLYSIYHFLQVRIPMLYDDIGKFHNVEFTHKGKSGQVWGVARNFSEFLQELRKRGLYPQ